MTHQGAARDADLLYELGTMRHIPRTWAQFGGLHLANNAEHSFRVAMTAMLIAEREGADHGRVAQLALIHDLPETRVGDVHYVSRLYTVRDENRALADLAEGTALAARIRGWWDEYTARETLESRVVKDADTLDVDLELREQSARGADLGAVLRPMRERVAGTFYTATARELFAVLRSRHPHAWHFEGRNRFTTGDWRPEGEMHR